MKNNLIIKYAILGLKEGINKDICGYIISKCYVINRDTIFDNDQEYVYDVFFPYVDFSMKRRNLDIDYCDIQGTLYTVSKLYDSYDDAVIEKKLNNSLLKNKILLNKYFNDDDITSFKSNIDSNFKKCDDYEKFILDNTKDMSLFSNNKSLTLKKH